MDLPKKKLSNTTGRNTRNTGLKKAVIQVAGSLEVDIFNTIMNGRATTWGVFKAYVFFLLIHKNDMAQNSNTLEQVYWTT